MSASRRKIKGFSIIELLIAVTLGLLLTVGLINIFINSKQSYRLQEATSRMQENGRFAVESLSRPIHLADFWGSVAPTQVQVVGDKTYNKDRHGGCKNAWLINPLEGLRGYEGAATVAATGLPTDGGENCIADSESDTYDETDIGIENGTYIKNSDVIALRYADPDPVEPAGLIDGKFYVRTLVGRSARLFNGGITTDITRDLAAPGAVLDYDFKPELYYLAMFAPTSGGINPSPTLYFREARKNLVEPTPLVEGIEMMNFEYGLDINGDLTTDRYLKASDITNPADWSKVLSVRVSLIVRGDEVDNFRDEKTYTMAGGDTYKAKTDNQRFLRTQIVKEVQVRNRVRIRG